MPTTDQEDLANRFGYWPTQPVFTPGGTLIQRAYSAAEVYQLITYNGYPPPCPTCGSFTADHFPKSRRGWRKYRRTHS